MTVLAALGQLFYSMSISMGILITYGSYMPKETSIEKSVHQIEIFDSGIAIIAGLIIVPSAFVYTGGGGEEMYKQGAGLMFQMLPRIFDTIPFGNVLGAVFFVLVFFAALTSSISLMEAVVAIIQDKLHWKRTTICLLVVVACIVLAVPSSLGYGTWSCVKILGLSILDFFDFISNSVIMPIVAILTCIFVGYIIKPKTLTEEIAIGGKFKSEKLFTVIIKYIAPVCILAILISSVLNSLGVIKI